VDQVRRSGVKEHADWKKNVDKAFPNAAAFRKKARAFEKLALDGKKRREGFAEYAPEVLPAPKKKKSPAPKKQKQKKKKKETRDFPPVWRTDKAVKKAIGPMSNKRCAYCQSNVRSNQAGHVEHFRPKTLFPCSAYLWKNYFLACEACNLAKGKKWPVASECKSYVRPDQNKPGKRFVFSADGKVKAKTGDKAAAATVRDIQLDRKDLRDDRRDHIELMLRPLRRALKTKGKVSAAEFKLQVVPALSQFSEAVNQCVLTMKAQH
jgi:uncharacterized protein (TIGR02646 family)